MPDQYLFVATRRTRKGRDPMRPLTGHMEDAWWWSDEEKTYVFRAKAFTRQEAEAILTDTEMLDRFQKTLGGAAQHGKQHWTLRIKAQPKVDKVEKAKANRIAAAEVEP